MEVLNHPSLFLRKLYLKFFRRYDEAFFQFDPGINTIVGPNAYGKTTILEAIHLLMHGRSFRTQQLADLIQHGQNSFYIEGTFVKQGIEQTLKISFDGKERKIVHNHTVCPTSTNLLGLLQGVITTPDHVSLVKGGPLLRRHFLDLQIAQVDPLYVHHLTRYVRAMRHRNILLKRKDLTTIKGWEQEMSNAAAYLTIQRKQAVDDLQKLVQSLYRMLADGEKPLVLTYKGSGGALDGGVIPPQYYLEKWNQLRPREKEIGVTLYGPHRDDLMIKMGDQEIRFFASEGEQRSCVVALRLAEWQRLNILTQERPLMLIDDVGVGLDQARRLRLWNYMHTLGQVFLTSTEEIRPLA